MGKTTPDNGATGDRFALAADALSLPPGASARATRAVLSLGDRAVLAFTRGPYRPCLHPVLTPAGHCVTAERPADHPHHSGVWIAADRVAWRAAGGPGEAHTYNFYVDDVFQGRAPGTIRETGIGYEDDGRVVQDLDWRGPREWGAPDGRVVLGERRETRVAAVADGYLIDTVSVLRAVGGSVELGPTRHAYFNVRVADVMSLAGAGRSLDSTPAPLAAAARRASPCSPRRTAAGAGSWPTGASSRSGRSATSRCGSSRGRRAGWRIAS
jgi:hypothetical protein